MVKIIHSQILLNQHVTARTTAAEFNMPENAALGNEIPASRTAILYQVAQQLGRN